MPVCDVCSKNMDWSDGYAQTTTQVTTNEESWRFVLTRHSFDDELLLIYVQQQAKQRSGWLVCESCSKLFEFNRQQAREYAKHQVDPPDGGPADVQYVAAAAAKAWEKLYGKLPSWLRYGEGNKMFGLFKNRQVLLVKVAGAGKVEKVKELLDAGADVNAKNKYGDTALISASAESHTEVVKVLLDARVIGEATRSNKDDSYFYSGCCLRVPEGG